MKTFQRAETVICSVTVKLAGVLTDPSTSMKIAITGPTGLSAVPATSMAHDLTGAYHYDYSPAADALLGTYRVKYTATDGSRVTIQTDRFNLE